LELVTYTADAEDVHTLVFSVDATQVSDAAHRVEKACLEKMLQFEDDVGTGKVKQAFILGLGKRILAYKKLISEATNTNNPLLMELSQLRECQKNQNQEPGTPTDNTSRASFFNKKWKLAESESA
jgi:hypothetical protein